MNRLKDYKHWTIEKGGFAAGIKPYRVLLEPDYACDELCGAKGEGFGDSIGEAITAAITDFEKRGASH